MSNRWNRCLSALLCGTALGCAIAQPLAGQTSSPLGIFEGQADVGSVQPAGTMTYDASSGSYTMTAAGANMWSTIDAFHFAWKKISGDVSLTADIDFPQKSATANPHRKAVLMFRQDLNPDSVYADAAQHGVGLTALQYRTTATDTTQDIELNITPPKKLRLEKRGDVITMFVSYRGEPLHQVGASIKLPFPGAFYAGIGLCSHDAGVVEKAVFTNVELRPLHPLPFTINHVAYGTLKTLSTDEVNRVATVVVSQPDEIQAPNWSKDGSYIVFNNSGRIYKVSTQGGEPQLIDTGNVSHCNGSHGFSPDGKWLAISCTTPDKPSSRVYIIPAGGGTPRQVTQNPNSYFHSWSPDGKTIAFTRPLPGGRGQIFAIPAEGGDEHPLTPGIGMDDDPDYSPDGQYIYFNSNRGGSMQIWRMHADGNDPEPITNDDYPNWTPHPSPDGKSLLILSYDKGETGHPANRDVTLRLVSLADKKVRPLIRIVGGSGTDNTPCWSPDGKHFAFVSYQTVAAQDPEESQ